METARIIVRFSGARGVDVVCYVDSSVLVSHHLKMRNQDSRVRIFFACIHWHINLA